MNGLTPERFGELLAALGRLFPEEPAHVRADWLTGAAPPPPELEALMASELGGERTDG